MPKKYPGTPSEYHQFFPDDDSCLEYLAWLRFTEGRSACPRCGASKWWIMANQWGICTNCRYRSTTTAGTIFEQTKLPLSVWFGSAWEIVAQKHGMSAKGLQRATGIRSYQTAWTILAKFRTAMVDPTRSKLSGDVEVDETLVGGVAPGKPGRTPGGKYVVVIAVESRTSGMGRVRLGVVPSAGQSHLLQFLQDNVEPGSVLLTDGWKGYGAAVSSIYQVKATSVSASGLPAHSVLPHVHRVAALLKRWLLGTFHGSVSGPKLQSYLDEFTFRFNRRRSSARGLLFYRLMCLAGHTQPTSYAQLIHTPNPKKIKPVPPTAGSRTNTPSMVPPISATRPWKSP